MPQQREVAPNESALFIPIHRRRLSYIVRSILTPRVFGIVGN